MPKLLGDFLQEQQEPFALDVYLLERGYYRHIIRPGARSSIQNSARFLKTSASCSQKKRHQQPVPSCAELFRTVLSRLALQNNRKIKKANDRDSKVDHAYEDEFTSASSTTLYSSCSESDAEDAECITKQPSFCLQLSPVSVLEETESQASPLHHKKQYNFKKTQGGSSTSTKSKQPTQEFGDSFDQHSINKRALQQTKQLLVDCVREVIENERKRDGGSGQQLKRILGAEELWKVVNENVWLWSQEPIHETNIVHLLNSDFMASLQEWKSASDQLKDEISVEIGDAILEDVINEIITCS